MISHHEEHHPSLRHTRAYLFDTNVPAPPVRNLTKEQLQTLSGYQQTAPGYLALYQQYQPLYTQLGLNQSQITQQGYTDSSGVYHPGTVGLSQAANTSNRTAATTDLGNIGPGATSSLLASNPFLANATFNAANLGNTLSGMAQSQLAQGGRLTPQEMRDASQQVQAGFAARGQASGNSSLITDVLNRDSLTRQRQLQAEQFASQTAGLNSGLANTFSQTVTNPILQMLGLGNLTSGSAYQSGGGSFGGAGAGSSFGSPTTGLFPSMSPYIQDLYSSNQSAIGSANNAQANADAATNAGYLNLIGQLGGAALSYSSDERLKKNIKKTGLKTATGIPYKTWTYPTDPKKRTYLGVMAQDVEKMIPGAVQTEEVSGIKSVDYRKAGAVMQELDDYAMELLKEAA